MFMRVIALAVSLLLVTTTSAIGARGEVVYRNSGCDYFVVASFTGYVLLEWYGGADPSVGDVLVGDFESYGTKDIFNVSTDSELRVWVEDYWLSKEDALEKLYEECE